MNRKASGGYTLLELMITVGVSSILASLAASSFLDMQLRAKRAELPINLAGIHASEVAYQHEFGVYLLADVEPRADAALDGKTVAWATTASGFYDMGWEPDGKVYGNYRVDLISDYPLSFRAIARSDVDNDNIVSEYQVNNIREPIVLDGSIY